MTVSIALYMVEDRRTAGDRNGMSGRAGRIECEYNAGYVETLQSYLKHNGSIQAVAEELYTHRNTVLYRLAMQGAGE